VSATVAECESSQTQVMLNFPRAIDPTAAGRGVEFALGHDARIVGAWLSPQTDARPLQALGFERGWEPWWMAARLDAIRDPDDPRTALSTDVPEYGPDGQRLLDLARGQPRRAWHAVARVDGEFAGRAWSLVSGDIAGVYDMEVWPRFERRGLGRSLLRTVCAAARAAGATRVVLNATAVGEPLYAAEGFVHVGRGITYWHHLGGACAT